MIYNYDDFILESQMTLILESAVKFTTDFKRILSKIESPVAEEILNLEDQDINVASNYFDITDTAEEIAFIPDKKAQSTVTLKMTFFSPLRSEMSDAVKNIYKKLEIDDSKYLEVSSFGRGTEFRILGSYHPSKEELYDSGGYDFDFTTDVIDMTYYRLEADGVEIFVTKNYLNFDLNPDKIPSVLKNSKQSVRIGRGIRALLKAAKKEFTDKQIEDFVARYRATWHQETNIENWIELKEGNAIAYWYSYEHYRFGESTGTIGSSCMRNVPGEYFDIYVQNPEVCKLLILKAKDEPDLILARALVWKLERPDITFMDRVYFSDSSELQIFREYAHSKGWYYKSDNTSTEDFSMVGKDKTLREYAFVRIKPGNHRFYPYMDSLKFINTSEGYLTNDANDAVDWRLESTGGLREPVFEECEYCNGTGERSCYTCGGAGDINCSDCNGSTRAECDDCQGHGEVTCKTCRGSEVIEDEDGQEIECPDCDGTGVEDCKACRGHGEVDCETCDSGRVECYGCDGDGSYTCGDCNGTGRQ